MTWVVSLALSTAYAFIFAFGFLLLWRTERSGFILLWTAGWVMCFLRYVFVAGQVLVESDRNIVRIVPQLLDFAGVCLIMLGTFRLVGLLWRRWWTAPAAALTGFTIASFLAGIPLYWVTLPLGITTGLVSLLTGAAFRKAVPSASGIRIATVWTFLLWGAYRIALAIVRASVNLVLFGYADAVLFEFSGAVATIILYTSMTKERLRESQATYHAAFFENLAPILLVDPVTRIITAANPSAVAYFGYPAERLIGMRTDELDPDREELERIVRTVSPDGSISITRRARRADGTIRDVELFVSNVPYEGRTLSHVIIHDVTEKRNAEEQIQRSLREKEVLLREIHHRVKNNLQVISSILSLEQSFVANAEDAERFENCRIRVHSIAFIHDQLYRSDDLAKVRAAAYIEELLNHIGRLRAEDNRSIRFVAEIEEIELDLNHAIPIGLIVTELVTNGLKHAFPDGRSGSLTVRLRRIPGADRIELAVSDTGAGLPPDFQERRADTLGLSLVEALARQLGGTLETSSEGGASFTVRFPLPQSESA